MNMKVKRGQLYFADLSPSIGSEQAGVRPVLVLQNDRYNAKSPTTIVAAVTGRHKNLMQLTHVLLSADSALPGSVVLLEQIRTIDKSRLGFYIGKQNKHELLLINQAIRQSLDLNNLEVLK